MWRQMVLASIRTSAGEWEISEDFAIQTIWTQQSHNKINKNNNKQVKDINKNAIFAKLLLIFKSNSSPEDDATENEKLEQ